MANKDTLINDNRIVYVDPNNAQGVINNVPVTPDYTNFCIWCNLIVERSSRLKNQAGGKNDNETYSIAFDMTNVDGASNSVSFMQGKDAERYNFLTTDYTNINFDEIRKRNIIEGLQIENVNISFTNYQTPLVTIKFVDIRGGGFFGREEATHNEYGKLSNLEVDKDNKQFDNFFGCFVSFPYPRFRLQVKGFYGKPVTFQLTCTSFSGKLNSTTGNFEITVQFIGYEYGVLGDIPFDLLVAAPMTAFGAKYWDEHVADMTNNGWALDGEKTEAPMKLFDFYQNISKEIQSGEVNELILDDSLESTMTETVQQMQKLNEIKTRIEDLKSLISKTFKPYYVSNCETSEENVVVIFSPTAEYNNTSGIEELWNKYTEYIKLRREYYNLYLNGNNSTVGTWYTQLPEPKFNEIINEGAPGKLEFTDFINHKGNGPNKANHFNKTTSGTMKMDNPNITACEGCKISQLFYKDEQYTVKKGVSKKLVEDLSIRNWAIYGEDLGSNISFAKFALVLNFGNTKQDIDDKMTELTEAYENYKYGINKQGNLDIRKITGGTTSSGFTPYIGRYFKMVMCHLETFVAMFNTCVDKIEEEIVNRQRVPSKLGIRDLTLETDVPGDVFVQVPPFPAVYKQYTTEEEANKALNNGKSIKANAWIGDFSGETEWQEKKIIDELYLAAQRISDLRAENSNGVQQQTIKSDKTSLMPFDYIVGIPRYAYTSKDGAMFYAALRVEMALRFMSGGKNVTEKEAEEMGMFDAYVYTANCTNKAFLEELNQIDHLDKELYNSTVFGNEFKSKAQMYFELIEYIEKRHPVFLEDGNRIKYSYMTNNAHDEEFIPLNNFSTFNKHNGFAANYAYHNGDDFNPKDNNADTFLIGQLAENDQDYYTKYPSAPHMTATTDQGKIDQVCKIYEDLNNGEIEIGNKPSNEIMSTINKHMLLSNEHFGEFHQAPIESFKSYKELNCNIQELLKNYRANRNELISKIQY